MKVTRRGRFIEVTQITGPTHHFLALEVTAGSPLGRPLVEAVTEDGTPMQLESATIAQALAEEILDVVRAVNRRTRMRFGIKAIRVGANDRFAPLTYRSVARAIMDHVAAEAAR